MCWEKQAATSQDYFGMVMLFRQTHCLWFQLNPKLFHCLRCDENLGFLQEYQQNQLFEGMSYINLFERPARNFNSKQIKHNGTVLVVTLHVQPSTRNTGSIQFNSCFQPMAQLVAEEVAITVAGFLIIINHSGQLITIKLN